MKTCAYCGRENKDDATICSGCGTSDFKVEKTNFAVPKTESETHGLTESDFAPLSPSELGKGLVLLMRCRTLIDAEMIVSQLEAAGIYAFIPDQFLMQTILFNVNTYGYVRIQVSPKDYAAAKEFLLAPPKTS
jgi:hypothetical protein